MSKVFVFLLLFGLSFLFACNKAYKAHSSCEGAQKLKLVNLKDLDGCGWVLQNEKGEYLIPSNIESYNIALEEAKDLYLKYKINEDAAGICMAGQIVDIICMRQ